MSAPLLRASLRAPLASGTAGPSSAAFLLPCRKLVLEYCEGWGANKGMRDFVATEAVRLAERFPGVEMVVKRVENRHPHLRGNYGRLHLAFGGGSHQLGLATVTGWVEWTGWARGWEGIRELTSVVPPFPSARLLSTFNTSV